MMRNQLLPHSGHLAPLCLCRKLPAIQRSSLKEKEEEEKVIPQVTPRMVDFIAKAIEQRKEVRGMDCCRECVLLSCRIASLDGHWFTEHS